MCAFPVVSVTWLWTKMYLNYVRMPRDLYFEKPLYTNHKITFPVRNPKRKCDKHRWWLIWTVRANPFVLRGTIRPRPDRVCSDPANTIPTFPAGCSTSIFCDKNYIITFGDAVRAESLQRFIRLPGSTPKQRSTLGYLRRSFLVVVLYRCSLYQS